MTQSYPLSATATRPSDISYGSHLVPDCESTDLDIPVLLAQPAKDLPSSDEWKKWGRWRRDTQSRCWHYYCNDYRFESTLRNPELLLQAGGQYAVEVNVSTYKDDPFPVVVSGLFRKRSVSRWWQEHGVTVFVDLNVCGVARELVLDGVPQDHGYFASKYQSKDLDGEPLGLEGLAEDYALALDHCGQENFHFLCYGGSKKVQAFCEEQGWLWLPNANNTIPRKSEEA